ncbi:hypothetical protein CFC21_106347 [Triticum aestivum]|uniref:Sulfotransferase n=2 Tax=Triticum aestivum TaxID=4565 RepID=A0A9R1N9H7_WHEAT|nr:hypothetical protein CFC21_106347 [Triticum aestivum]
MAALGRIVGPVPFKDVVQKEEDEHPPEEYADIIATLPSITTGFGPLLCYQGVWLRPWMVPGVIAVQRHLAPRPDDVLLASPPKCGTTWLKALSLATMVRATYPPSGADDPLLRLNPHDCVPHLEALFSAGQEAKLEALPRRRLPLLRSVRVCIWDHILGYLRAKKASPERVLFLRYEEMLLDPVSSVLGVPFTAGFAHGHLQAVQHRHDERHLEANNTGVAGLFVEVPHQSFFRKGVVGEGEGHWANHMTPEMARRIDAIVEDKLRGSGLSFTR